VIQLLLSILVSDILPIFFVTAAGYLLARYAGVSVQPISRLVFFVLMPCLAFRMLLTSTASGPDVGRIILLGVITMGTMGVIGFLAAKALGLDSKLRRAFMMVVMFSNSGNYGLPVVQFAFGPTALTFATIYFLTGSATTYVSSAFFAGSRRGNLAGAFDKIWRMPSLYGVALAAIFLALGIHLPEAVMRPVGMLSDAALPVMIMVLGMQLERAVWPPRPGLVLLAVTISLVVTPILALGFCSALGITGPARQAAIVLSSMPVAVVTTILALEFNLDPQFVTSAVFVSTLISPLTLTPLIAYLS
jgi:malate permease and related proteins